MSTTEQVLSEFIDAWNAGRRPSVRDYLARAPNGPARDELADQITSWLEFAPTPAYDESGRAAIRADPVVARLLAAAGDDAGIWPAVVPQLRTRIGLSIGEVGAILVDRLALDPGEADRATDYLERLETGRLDPARLSRRLLDALGSLLGVSGRSLADSATFGRGLRPATAGGALFRGAGELVRHDLETLSRAALTPAPPAMDELDRLFTGGPDA